MKKLIIGLIVVAVLQLSFTTLEISGDIPETFYEFKMKAIDGTMVDFSTFKGKKVLLVNVASECGFTPQYEDLQKLHELYGNKVAVLGFPANNFGAQEPGTNEEILAFCTDIYGVDFPMFAKISVKGDDIHPLYQYLTTAKEKFAGDITWNFNKFLISPEGEITNRFTSKVEPESEEITGEIDKLLK